MRRVVLAVAIVLAFTVSPAQAAQMVDVGLAGSQFRNGPCPTPAGNNIATINVGDSVKWTNCDPYDHDIEWDSPGFSNPPAMPQNGFVVQLFNKDGFFEYHCKIHPSMTGTVVVRRTAPSTTKPTAPPATTTTAPTITTTTATTVDLGGVFGGDTTTSSSPVDTTTTTTIDQEAIASKDKGASGPVLVLLLAAIAAVIGGGVFAVRRMRQP